MLCQRCESHVLMVADFNEENKRIGHIRKCVNDSTIQHQNREFLFSALVLVLCNNTL